MILDSYIELAELCRITTGNLNANAMDVDGIYPFFTCSEVPSKINSYAFDAEAILISGNGSRVGHVNYWKGKFNAYQRTYVLTDFSEKSDANFLFFYLKTFLRNYISFNVKKGAIPYITLPMLQEFPVISLSFEEQKRIAEVLSTWGEGIERLERVIALKEKRKRALMRRLLSGKTRLPGFSAPWKEVKLGEIVSIVSRTVGCSRAVAMSISAGRGFVPQSEKFGRDISGKQYEKYTLLKLGEFAYNKGNSKRYPQGCVYRLKEHKEVAIPNVFISFRVDETLCFPQFMESYFEANKHGKWLCRVINSGVRNNGLLNLNTEDFLKMPVGLPSLEEQVSIAKVLLAALQELSFLRRKCELLKLQKKWLMQQLLTGKKRLVK